LPASERKRGVVRPVRHSRGMNNSRRVRGTELRYLLTMHLFIHGPATITELVETLSSQGFEVGYGPKVVSDALRWEVRRGRVYRRGRGRYGPGWMPRSTEYRIHKRVLALRAEAAELSLRGGQLQHPPGSPPARASPKLRRLLRLFCVLDMQDIGPLGLRM
jgi:hypothetical protein